MFRITRSSVYDDAQPCPEAGKTTVPRWDVRTFKSAEEHDTKIGHGPAGRWADRGTDHQVLYGPRGGARGIRRRMGDEVAWFLDLGSLEDLLAFIGRHGDVVVMTDPDRYEDPVIEIYDGYRE